MGRNPCCSKEGMNRGAWTAIEDKILTDYIKTHGEGRWRNLPQKAGLKRCGKSCRLRWLNYLRPDIKRGNISPDEEGLIIRLHKLLGNRWSLIAGRLPGRTDNEIKNYWNTNLGKKQSNTTENKHNPSPITRMPRDSKSEQPSQGRVVRTKAVKCSKVVLSHLGHVGQCDKDQSISRHSSENLDETFNVSDCVNLVLEPSSGQISQANVENSSADFDLDELLLADFLMDSDYSACYNSDANYFANVSRVSTSYWNNNDCGHDDRLLFSEESTVPNWSANNSDVVDLIRDQQNVGPEFNYFTSLTLDGDSEEDWLAAD